jgi:ankyrin repeat protein
MLKKILKVNIEKLLFKNPINHKKLIKYISSGDIKAEYLFKAAAEDRVDVIEFLYTQGININIVDSNNETALFYAVKRNSQNAISKLINLNADMNRKNNANQTILYHLIRNKNMKFLPFVIGKTIDRKYVNQLYVELFDNSEFKDILLKLIELKAVDINTIDDCGNSIIHTGFFKTKYDEKFYRKLVELKIDLNIFNKQKKDFLHLNLANLNIPNSCFQLMLNESSILKASSHNQYLELVINELLYLNNQEIVNKSKISTYMDRLVYLYIKGFDFNSTNERKETILFDAVKAKKYELSKLLLEKTDIDVNQKNIEKRNILYYAIFTHKPDFKLITLLLEHRVNCLNLDINGFSVLDYLINLISHEYNPIRVKKNKSILGLKNINASAILGLLLEYGNININKVFIEGEPILHYVVKTFNVYMIEKILKYKGDINILNKEGLNALHALLRIDEVKNTERSEFINTIKFLVQRNIDILEKDSFGGNIIHYSILKYDFSIVSIFLKRISDFKSVDKLGRNFIHYAVWNENISIIRKISNISKELLNLPDKFGFLPLNYAILLGKKDAAITLLKNGAFINNKFNINEQFKKKFLSQTETVGYNKIFEKSMTSQERALIEKVVSVMKEKIS